jgi:hypothetical protein
MRAPPDAENRIAGRRDALGGFDDLVLAREHAIDLHALAQRREVRRRVRSDSRAGRAHQRGEHRDGRALAVRAADVDDGTERAIRRAHAIKQLAHALEAELHAEATRADEPLEQLDVRHRA